MKLLGIISSLLLLVGCGTEEKFDETFFPKNTLRRPANVESMSNVTEEQFNAVIDAAKKVFAPIAKQNKEKLIINNLWSDATVNANVSRYNNQVTINMYGGLARHEIVHVESFALVLAHELSHAYCWYFTDKVVYISSYRKMCSESNADYNGNGDIIQLILAEMNKSDDMPVSISTMEFIDKSCSDKWNRDTEDYDSCVVRLNAGQQLGDLLASLRQESNPNFETRDLTEVEYTLTSYPATVQCRLDNYFDGVFHSDYSKCWFKYPVAP